MGIKEKLPLINSKTKGIRIVGYVVYTFVFLLFVMILGILISILISPTEKTVDAEKSVGVGGHAASVDISGWTFTADLGDQWQLKDPRAVEDGNSVELVSNGVTVPRIVNWEGVKLNDAFWLPRKGAVLDPKNLPSITDTNQNDLLASVSIQVNKVPEEDRGEGAQDILAEFYEGGFGTPTGGSVKEIEFNGKPALLSEQDFDYVSDANGRGILPKCSTGDICILMTDDTIAMLTVTTLPDSDLRAWDVIEKFTISPSRSSGS